MLAKPLFPHLESRAFVLLAQFGVVRVTDAFQAETGLNIVASVKATRLRSATLKPGTRTELRWIAVHAVGAVVHAERWSQAPPKRAILRQEAVAAAGVALFKAAPWASQSMPGRGRRLTSWPPHRRGFGFAGSPYGHPFARSNVRTKRLSCASCTQRKRSQCQTGGVRLFAILPIVRCGRFFRLQGPIRRFPVRAHGPFAILGRFRRGGEQDMMAMLCVGLGGFVGAVGRYLLGLVPLEGGFPLMTFLINFVGAVVIGAVFKAATVWPGMSDNAVLFLNRRMRRFHHVFDVLVGDADAYRTREVRHGGGVRMRKRRRLPGGRGSGALGRPRRARGCNRLCAGLTGLVTGQFPFAISRELRCLDRSTCFGNVPACTGCRECSSKIELPRNPEWPFPPCADTNNQARARIVARRRPRIPW